MQSGPRQDYNPAVGAQTGRRGERGEC